MTYLAEVEQDAETAEAKALRTLRDAVSLATLGATFAELCAGLGADDIQVSCSCGYTATPADLSIALIRSITVHLLRSECVVSLQRKPL